MSRSEKLSIYLLFSIMLPIWLAYISSKKKDSKDDGVRIEADSSTIRYILNHFEKNSQTDSTFYKEYRQLVDSLNRHGREIEDLLKARLPPVIKKSTKDSLPPLSVPKKVLWFRNNFISIPELQQLLKNLRQSFGRNSIDTSSGLVRTLQLLEKKPNLYKAVIIDMDGSPSGFANDLSLLDSLDSKSISIPFFFYSRYNRRDSADLRQIIENRNCKMGNSFMEVSAFIKNLTP